MVDVLSRGRLEAGFVRGVPYEVLPANSNPVRMNERHWEALDLIIKAWTTHDGPFSHEGRFFHYRAVNIWPRRYQQPHPPVWISTTSPSGAARVGAHGFVQATFLTGFDGTRAIYDAYRSGWREAGRGNDVPVASARLCGAGLHRAERGGCARRGGEAAVVHHLEQGAAALRQPARLCAGAGQCRDAARRRASAERVPQIRQRGRRDRGRHHVRRHARSGASADQEALRPCRRLRPSADHGPGRASSSTTTPCSASAPSRANSIRGSRRSFPIRRSPARADPATDSTIVSSSPHVRSGSLARSIEASSRS